MLQPSTKLRIENTKTAAKKERPVGVASSPFQKSTSYKISRLKFSIKMVNIPAERSCNMQRPMKDDLKFKVSGPCSIPGECGKVFIGQTGQSIETICKRHE